MTKGPDVPVTPDLLLDTSAEMLASRRSDVTPPSPSPAPRPRQTSSYQPRPLALVEKHLSNNSITAPVLDPTTMIKNKPVIKKSTKGYKPRPKAASPTKQQPANAQPKPSVRPLSPVKRLRAVAKARPASVFVDEHVREALAPVNANAFLPGRTLSARRKGAFTAARRKLEGVGSPDEQTDRSSGTSSDERETKGAFSRESAVLEAAGGAVDASSLQHKRPRPKPSQRRSVRNLRV